MAETAKPNEKPSAGLGGCLVGFALVVVVLFFVFSSCGDSTSSSRPPEEVITRPNGQTIGWAEASVMCESQVKQQLVSPATARFAGVFSDQYTAPRKVGNTWVVRSVVDAQNAFGATIRGVFLCTLDGDRDTIVATQVN